MKVNRITHSRDMVIRNFPRWRAAESWIGSIRSAVPEKRIKHEVDRMTRCRDMAVRNFPKCEVGRSVVGPQYVHCSHVLFFATLGT